MPGLRIICALLCLAVLFPILAEGCTSTMCNRWYLLPCVCAWMPAPGTDAHARSWSTRDAHERSWSTHDAHACSWSTHDAHASTHTHTQSLGTALISAVSSHNNNASVMGPLFDLLAIVVGALPALNYSGALPAVMLWAPFCHVVGTLLAVMWWVPCLLPCCGHPSCSQFLGCLPVEISCRTRNEAAFVQALI